MTSHDEAGQSADDSAGNDHSDESKHNGSSFVSIRHSAGAPERMMIWGLKSADR